METEDEISLEYKRGNATLRSSTHTLTYSKTRKVAAPPQVCKVFPIALKRREILEYDIHTYNFTLAITRILISLNPDLVGSFPTIETSHRTTELSVFPKLEYFYVPPYSLRVKRPAERQIDHASESLTSGISNDDSFMSLFDSFVLQVVLPYMKRRLHTLGMIQDLHTPMTFYYQRPPTLRIQPGPSTQSVMLHRDGDYGHQEGELNFWFPLTDRTLTQTELWVESQPDEGDYTPVEVNIGQVSVFHGTSCRHYVPPNKTRYTRVSLDFRVGVQDYFDPHWKMRGTKDDHFRRTIEY